MAQGVITLGEMRCWRWGISGASHFHLEDRSAFFREMIGRVYGSPLLRDCPSDLLEICRGLIEQRTRRQLFCVR